MSGHSKWAQIKRKKGSIDQKRGKLFTQMAKTISMAARDGADPEANMKLKLAIQRAKSFNVPGETIQRALERAAAAKEGEGFTEQNYEAYGPAGSAFVIKTITDNKNRTVSELKHILSLHGGKLAQSGGVSWMFEDRGIIEVEAGGRKEEIEMVAIDNDAIDFLESDDAMVIYTRPHDLHAMQEALKNNGVVVSDAYLGLIAKDHVSLSPEDQKTFEALYAELEEHDDVNDLYTNVS
jgi:YebC/PmpR family DNA-binding regulatory protein